MPSLVPRRHRYRLAVASRAIAAIPVNYVLTSVIVALMARTLPMAAADASVAATLASFAIFAVIALAIFSARSTANIWMWMIGSLLILGGALWFSLAMGGRL